MPTKIVACVLIGRALFRPSKISRCSFVISVRMCPYVSLTSTFKTIKAEQAIARAHWERAITKAKEHRDEPRLQQLLALGASLCGAFVWQSEPEKSHGRIETRRCWTISAKNLPMASEWKDLATLVRIDRERISGDKTARATIYYISSLSPSSPRLIAEAIRDHWGVENGLHWRLDVVFRKDSSRYRNRVGACKSCRDS